jgi:hypothetical protein
MPKSYVEKYQGIFNGNIASTSTGTGTLVVTGGIGTNGRVSANDVKISATTSSTTTATGALVVGGGIGLGGNIIVYDGVGSHYIGRGGVSFGSGFGGRMKFLNTLSPQGSIDGSDGLLSLTSDTGVESVSIEATTGLAKFKGDIASTSTSTGTLVVTGGVGISGNLNVGGTFSVGTLNSTDLTVSGNLIVNGTTTTINSTTMTVDDNNIELGSVDTPTDVTANNGGITLRGATNKTINWTSTGNNWTSSENFDLANTKVYKINNTQVLSSTQLGSAITFGANTASTSTGTGTLVVTGGVGVSGRVSSNEVYSSGNSIVSGNLYIGASSGDPTPTNTTGAGVMIQPGVVSSTSTMTGTLVCRGGIGVRGVVNIGGYTGGNEQGTESTSTSTGSLVVTGGIGVSLGVNANNIQASAIGNVTAGTGAFTTLSSSGATTMTQNVPSTSTGTGTLVVTGGIGVSGVIHCRGIKTNKLNPGVTLIYGATPSPKISIKFPIDFKTVSESSIFEVPINHMFLIDSMEVITTLISGAATPPTVRLGNTSVANAYYGPTQVTSNSVGARHIIENPQDGVAAGTTVTCGVTVASTATSHNGFIKVSGELIDLSEIDAFFDETGSYEDEG